MSKPTILVVLQNPYARGKLRKGQKYNPSTWRKEYLSSRTGVRLRSVLPDDWAVHFTNSNPTVGARASSRLEPDLTHISKRLWKVNPDIVLACGVPSQRACAQIYDGPLIGMPHPACRVVTNALLEVVRMKIEQWENGRAPIRISIRQVRGAIQVEGRYTIVGSSVSI